jgi:hypothetical protein
MTLYQALMFVHLDRPLNPSEAVRSACGKTYHTGGTSTDRSLAFAGETLRPNKPPSCVIAADCVRP